MSNGLCGYVYGTLEIGSNTGSRAGCGSEEPEAAATAAGDILPVRVPVTGPELGPRPVPDASVVSFFRSMLVFEEVASEVGQVQSAPGPVERDGWIKRSGRKVGDEAI